MKNVNKLLFCLGVTIACLAGISQSAYAAVAGHVQFVNGDVQITNPAGQTRPAQKGDAVSEGDTVTSAQSASAQIKMQDGGFVAVRADTKLKFDQFIFAGKQDGNEKSFFSLFKGGFRAVTGLIGQINKQNYKITTPAATIGIRGTDHETFLIVPGSPLAQIAPAGAYNKVNVGETSLTTDKGTINVLPNQMGFAGGMNQAPQLQPLNTKVFTVAEAATPEAKAEKKEEKKEEKAEANQEQTAKSDKEEKQEEKKEAGKEGGEDTKQADKGNGEATGDTQEAKQEGAAAESKPASAEQAASTSTGQSSDTAAAAGGSQDAAAGGAAQGTTTAAADTAPAPALAPVVVIAPQEPAPIRVSAVVDAVPPSAGLIQTTVSPVIAAPTVVAPVIAPPSAPTTVVNTAPIAGGITVNLITGTATTNTGQVITITQSLVATQAQTAADAAAAAATAAQAAATAAALADTTLVAIAPVSVTPATTAIATATTDVGSASTAVSAATVLTPADAATATANAASVQATTTAAASAAAAAQAAFTASGTFADSTAAGPANTTVQSANSALQTANTTVQTGAGTVAAQNTALATAQSEATTALTNASTNLNTANADLATANTQNATIITAQAATPTQVTAAQAAADNAQAAATAAQTAATLAASLQAAGDLAGAQAQLSIAQQKQVFAEQQLVLAQAAQTTAASQLAAAQTAAIAASTAVTAAEQKAIVAAMDAATASAQATAAQTAASNAAAALAQTDPAVVEINAKIVADNAPIAAYNNPNILSLPGASHNLMAGQPVTGGWLEVWDTNYGVPNTEYVLDGNKNLVEMHSAGYSTYDQTLLVQWIPNVNVKFAGGVAQDTYVAPDSSIYMGRWQGGGITVTDMAATAPVAPFTTNLGASSAHWVIGQMVPETLGVSLVQSLAGTTSYTMSAFTKPTDSYGNVGTVTNATLSANFTAQTVASTATFTFSTTDPVNISAKNQAFAINQTAMPIINSGFNDSWPAMTTTVSCDGADCGTGTWSAWLYGDFTGATASSAYVDYALFNRAATGSVHTDMVQSIIAFNTAIPPTVAQPYVQTDVSLEISLSNNYGSTYYYGGNSMTAAANVAPTATTPSFRWDYGCVNCGNHTVQLPGATGVVNGNATSFATTGIQFGRWTNVSAISETFTHTFGPGQINTGTGSSWAYAPEGYLDTPTILSAATGGTVQGVFNYVLNGTAPAPTDQYGTAGTLNSLTLAANFTTQTVSAALSVSLGTTTWTANSTTGVINGTGAGFNSYLTVTSSNLSVSTSGYLNGAFTGQNYAGAIVDYVIHEWPLAGGATTTSISGVAALTRNGVTGNATVANGTTALTGKFVVAEGGGYHGSLQTADTVTASAGVLTGYTTTGYNNMYTSSGSTITCTTCTGQAAPDTATGIQFGTWDAGSRAYNYDWTFGGQFHWIQGPGLDPIYLPEVLLGTMAYTLDGGTAPTNQIGLTGTLSSASLAVNFTTQTVNIALGLTGVNGHDWTASSVGTPLSWTNYSKNGFYTGALNVTMDGATAGSGYITGQLTGSGLNGALFQYNLNAPLPMPTVPATSTATDTVTVQAPSVTMTECCTSGGPLTATFQAGTSGTLVLQQATTLDLILTAGVPTSATLSGGVNDSVTLTPRAGFTDSYYEGASTATATPGYAIEVDTMGYLIANSGVGVAGGLKYSNFGEWRKFPVPTGTFPASTTGAYTSGFYAGGSLPTTAGSMTTAYYGAYTSYSGYQIGGAQDSTTNMPYKLGGWVSLNANFVTGTLTGTMSIINVTDNNGFAGYFNDLSLSATVTAYAFSGSVTANAAPAGLTASPVNVTVGTVGTTSGHFYGPNANELTGIWQLASGTIMAAGSFGAANGSSNMAPVESVNGTVALVAATPADVATQYRLVGLSAFDSVALASPAMYSDGGMVVDGGFNNVARVTEVAGGVTAFDSGFGSDYYYNYTYHDSAKLDIGTATAAGLGTDPATGISWGRWDGGTINITDRTTGVVTPVVLETGSLHWIATPNMTAPVALPTTGTYNYVLAGGTVPTDNLGNVGTLNSASLAANFTNQTIDVGVNVGISAMTLVANGTGIPIQQRAMFDAATANAMGSSSAGLLTATCAGTGCGASSPQARISGAFTGATGAGAAMLYGFTNNGHVVSGVAAFK